MKLFFKILPALLILGFFGYKYIYQAPKYDDGEQIPNFESTLLDGNAFALEDLRGSYVLLDFWGSWCGPCRQDNPNLVKLYKEFNGKRFTNAQNFEIVSVAIETKKERCIKAIKDDQLDWPYHIVLLDRFKSEIAKSFGVREIPTKYLLSPSGEILSVNESYESLRNRLLSQLK